MRGRKPVRLLELLTRKEVALGRDERRRFTGLFKREELHYPRICQGPESVLLYRSGLTMASSVFG